RSDKRELAVKADTPACFTQSLSPPKSNSTRSTYGSPDRGPEEPCADRSDVRLRQYFCSLFSRLRFAHCPNWTINRFLWSSYNFITDDVIMGICALSGWANTGFYLYHCDDKYLSW